MRVVFDTNVVLSASLWGGPPKRAIANAVIAGHIIVSTEALLAELKVVLARPKFHEKFVAAGTTPELIFADFVGLVEIATPAEIPLNIVRDPKDRSVLAAGVGGKANYIVSGDKDLLVLGVYENILIIGVDEFLGQIT